MGVCQRPIIPPRSQLLGIPSRVRRSGHAGSTGFCRPRARIWLFSSTLSTSARWGQIEPDYVADLVDEQRVTRQLEGLGAVRLEPEGGPDATDRGIGDACRASHRADRPVGRISRDRAQCALDHGRGLIVTARPWATKPSLQQPSRRSFRKRRRHLPTVCSCTPNSAATTLLWMPSAQRR